MKEIWIKAIAKIPNELGNLTNVFQNSQITRLRIDKKTIRNTMNENL